MENIVLNEYQKKIVREAIQSLNSNNQAAISVFPSGGKSYMGAIIAKIVLDKMPKKDVLWLGPKSANDNVYSSVIQHLDSKYKSRIKMVHYESLSRGQLPNVDKSNISLVVLDESHKALANNRGPFVRDYVDNAIYVLAMTATSRRTDGRDSFDILVPKAEYNDYDISWAEQNGEINKIHTYSGNYTLPDLDIQTLNELCKISDRYPELKDKCFRVKQLISHNSFEFVNDTADIMLESGMDVSGKHGGRFVVFFSKIDKIDQKKKDILDIFQRVYKGCHINLYEYHSKTSSQNQNNILNNVINREAKPYIIDVIMTVDKGIESIHPRGMRGLLIYRKTESNIVFTQMMGRGISLKGYSNNDSYVFDFCNRNISILAGNTIRYGKRITADRVEGLRKMQSLEEMEDTLNKSNRVSAIYDANYITKWSRMSASINELYGEITIARLNKLLEIKKSVMELMDDEDGFITSLDTLFRLASKYARLGLMSPMNDFVDSSGLVTDETRSFFRELRHSIINESIDKNSELYKLIQKIGYLVYEDFSKDSDYEFMEAIDIISSRKNRKQSYKDKSGMSEKTYKMLVRIRKYNLMDALSTSVCGYARDKGIDITIEDYSMEEVKSLTPKDEAEVYKDFMTEVKAIEDFRATLLDYSSKKLTLEETRDLQSKSYDIQVKHLYNMSKYNSAFANFLRHKIETEYADELKYGKLSEDEKQSVRAIFSICRSNSTIKGIYQDFLYNHPSIKDLNGLERTAFRYMGVNNQSKYNEILENTDWKQSYNKAVDGDVQALANINRISDAEPTEYQKKLLNKRMFKYSVKEVGKDLDKELALKNAMGFYDGNSNIRDYLNKALKSKVVTEAELVACVLDGDKKMTEEFIASRESGTEFWEPRKASFRSLVMLNSANVSCAQHILANLHSLENMSNKTKKKIAYINDSITLYKQTKMIEI